MGRERQTSGIKPSDLAEGVSIRTYASGNQAIQIQFSYRGKTYKELLKGVDPTKKANIKYANNLKAAIEDAKTRGTFKYSDYFPESKHCQALEPDTIKPLLIRDAVNNWLADAKRTVESTSLMTYEKLAKRIINYFGDYDLLELAENPEIIREFVRESDSTLKTMRNYLLPLRQIYDTALNDDLIQYNPLDRIVLKKLISKEVQYSDYDPDPLSPEEIAKYLDAAKRIRPQWLNYFQFMIYTGLRPSEAYALEWSGVDLVKGEIKVTGAVVMRKSKGTKTESSKRTVHLLPKALEALAAQYQLSYSKAGHVWINPNTNKPISDYEHSSRQHKIITEAACIRYRNQYQLRHTYCSNKLMAGDNIYYVANQMGHVDIEMVSKVYGKYIKGSRDPERYTDFRDASSGTFQIRSNHLTITDNN